MPKESELSYGLDGWEYVEPDIEMAVERVIEEACEPIGEGFDAIADQLEWPLEIKLYRDTGDE